MISNALKATGNYSDHDIMLFEREVNFRQVDKHDVFLKQGAVANQIFYLVHGAAYQQMSSDDGSLQFIELHTQGEWFLNYQSFVNQMPSQVSISAYTDCELLEISIESIHFLIGQSLSFLQMNNIMQQATLRLNLFDNALTPSEKYALIVTKRPELLQIFSLKMIASYLKVTPETLSRVRKTCTKRNYIS